jgi:hypothetical protein
MITERSYVAVVEGKPAKEMDLLTSFLGGEFGHEGLCKYAG